MTVLTNFRILYISTYLYESYNYHPANTEISFSGFFSSFPLALFLSLLKVLLSPYPGPALKYFAFNKRLSFCSRCQFQSVGLQTESTLDNWFILRRDHTWYLENVCTSKEWMPSPAQVSVQSARTGARRIHFGLNFMNKLRYDEECSLHWRCCLRSHFLKNRGTSFSARSGIISPNTWFNSSNFYLHSLFLLRSSHSLNMN